MSTYGNHFSLCDKVHKRVAPTDWGSSALMELFDYHPPGIPWVNICCLQFSGCPLTLGLPSQKLAIRLIAFFVLALG